MKKKLFTLFSLLMVFVCGMKGQTEVLIDFSKGTVSGNVWTGLAGTDVEGYVLTCSNTTKTVSKGMNVDGHNVIKFSNGAQYSLTLPASVSVSKIKFVAYANATANSYLFELNGTNYTTTDYIFPAKGTALVPATATHEIEFKPLVNSNITFTFKGKESAGYIVLTLSAPGLSDNATLSSIKIGEEEATLNGTTYSYELPASHAGETASVVITPASDKALVTVSTDATPNTTAGAYTATVAIGTPVTVSVKAEAGNTSEYTLSLTKASTMSSDTSLSALTVDGQATTPVEGETGKYTFDIPYAYDGALEIVATPTDNLAIVSDITTPTVAAGASVNVNFTVTAEDQSTQDYTLTITRAAASTECVLKSFAIDGFAGTINETAKTVEVKVVKDYDFSHTPVMNISALATAVWDKATMKVTVTAEDGVAATEYIVSPAAENILPYTASAYPYELSFAAATYTEHLEWIYGAPYNVNQKDPTSAEVVGCYELAAESAAENSARGTNALNIYLAKCGTLTLKVGATGGRNLVATVNGRQVGSLTIGPGGSPTGEYCDLVCTVDSDEPVVVTLTAAGSNGGTRIYSMNVTEPLSIKDDSPHNLSFTGAWDAAKFAELVSGKEVWSVDLTEVTDITGSKPANISNPNCLYYVKGNLWENEANVVDNDIKTAQNITLADGNPFLNQVDFTAIAASYTRTFTAVGTYSICLPFAVANIPGEVMVLEYKGSNGAKVNFSQVSAMAANTPYLVEVSADNINKEIKFEAVNITVEASASVSVADAANNAYTFNSNFKPFTTTAAQGLYLLEAGGTGFVKAGTASVGSFRAYIAPVSNEAAKAPRLVIGNDEGGATGIDASEAISHELSIYSAGGVLELNSPVAQRVKVYGVDGRLVRVLQLSEGNNVVSGLAKGMYIIANRKVVIK